MSTEQIINQLISLKEESETHIDQVEKDSIWIQDVKAINYAIADLEAYYKTLATLPVRVDLGDGKFIIADAITLNDIASAFYSQKELYANKGYETLAKISSDVAGKCCDQLTDIGYYAQVERRLGIG